eukprot:gb/GFBE01055091.1/.p1 GENE.gb/GFBE01055091.1/~~gb/GFBE01055091.1/.p1  ORF type:complete len:536 (+),score=158.55 gb/GFBE01055091.1/:1-1608(+)
MANTSARQPAIEGREDDSLESRLFPMEIFKCCPVGVRAVLPGTWLKIQDFTHLTLVVGTVACCIQVLQTMMSLANPAGSCLGSMCVKEILSLAFILPCVWYILTIIGQYDDRLQSKQKAAKEEKENLAQSYNDLISDMDGLLSKSAESSAGLAERSFESKRRDFQRFLEKVKSKYTTMYSGTKADSDQLLKQFRRFCINWLNVFEECSIDPVNCPKRVVTADELKRCTSIVEVADLCLERLRITEVRFISIQRDQDAQLIRKNKHEYRRITDHSVRASAVLALPAPSASSSAAASRLRSIWPSWFALGGPKEFSFKSSPTQDKFPKEIRFGCGYLVILSFEHARLLLGIVAGLFLIMYDISGIFSSRRIGLMSMADILVAEVCLIVMLIRFEELDIIQQLEREVKELARQNQQVEQQREKMTEFWSNAQQLTELWLYRTVPRLDLYKEVHSQLEDAPKEDLLTNISGANQKLEDLDRQLGALEGWRKDGNVSSDDKKVFGKAINEICQEEELDKILIKLEDAMTSKLSSIKALKN